MHVDILRPAPAHVTARYPRVESVRIKSGNRSGTFTVWAEPAEHGPTVYLNVRTAQALTGPVTAALVNASYPGPGNLHTPDSSD